MNYPGCLLLHVKRCLVAPAVHGQVHLGVVARPHLAAWRSLAAKVQWLPIVPVQAGRARKGVRGINAPSPAIAASVCEGECVCSERGGGPCAAALPLLRCPHSPKEGIVPPAQQEHGQVTVWRGQWKGLCVLAAAVAIEEGAILAPRVGPALCLQVALARALPAGLVLPRGSLLAAIEEEPCGSVGGGGSVRGPAAAHAHAGPAGPALRTHTQTFDWPLACRARPAGWPARQQSWQSHPLASCPSFAQRPCPSLWDQKASSRHPPGASKEGVWVCGVCAVRGAEASALACLAPPLT